MEITNFEIEVLKHTARTGRYVTDEPGVLAVAEAGLLHNHGVQKMLDGMSYFTLTAIGREVLLSLPKPKPLTRSQRRYRKYLDMAECFNGSFRDFLRSDSAKV